MNISIRRFTAEDVSNKVRWINDRENNRFLHYDLPLDEERTAAWFETIKSRNDRFDAVILADNKPVGLIGLLNIDDKNQKAEFYIAMGERSYKGKGIATEAGKNLLRYAFEDLCLNRVYLYTETENIPAQKLFEKLGFVREGRICEDLYSRGRFVDRFVYGISKAQYGLCFSPTPIRFVQKANDNNLFIKRDDLFPISFGGNKARKAMLFFRDIEKGDYDCVVTYGSSSSNHCRVVSNLAAAKGQDCYIISPSEQDKKTYNRQMMGLFGAEIIMCPVSEVSDMIEQKITELRDSGRKPYFIPGGGHGNIGTQAYVDCFREIKQYEIEHKTCFDYIFFASGTGTTQAGLICGKIISDDSCSVVGISIARKNPYGRDVVKASVREYLDSVGVISSSEQIDDATVFDDTYAGDGYGKKNDSVENVIKNVLIKHGIPLDETYTGKAYHGMLKYIEKNDIKHKNILFIHTGGTPLFFDDLLNK